MTHCEDCGRIYDEEYEHCPCCYPYDNKEYEYDNQKNASSDKKKNGIWNVIKNIFFE